MTTENTNNVTTVLGIAYNYGEIKSIKYRVYTLNNVLSEIQVHF